MAKSKQGFDKRKESENLTLKQGFVRDEDLEPETDGEKLLSPQEVDSYAEKARASATGKSDKLQGEGDYEAAQSYDDAATDFARNHDGGKQK